MGLISAEISLHLQSCNHNCKNRNVCYHINKNIKEKNIIDINSFREQLLSNYNAKFYESICAYNEYYLYLIRNYSNYNITISCDVLPYKIKQLEVYKNQLQITVYNIKNIRKFKNFQKLFLIKDKETLNLFYKLTKKITGNLHFIFDSNLFKNKIINIIDIINIYQGRKDKRQTLDNCITNYLFNGRCPFSYNNYIDITYDNTIRKCPYKKEGINIEKNLHDYFKLNFKPDCIYSSLFRETHE